MTDDIVSLLRDGHGQGCKCAARCYCECGCDAVWAEHYLKDAADEIERLREENRELLEIAKNFSSHGRCDVYEQEWGMCLHANCEWHNTEHAWETYCMRRGL